MKIKNYIQIFILINICSYCLHSQNPYLPARAYQSWNINNPSINSKITFYDESLKSDTSDGYNCYFLKDRLYAIDDNYLYLVYTMIIKSDAEGYSLIKYDLDKSDLVWKKTITLNELSKRELPAAIKINENKNIEVLSLQKRQPFDPIFYQPFYLFDNRCGIIKREFSKDNGNTLNEQVGNEHLEFMHSIFPTGNANSFFRFMDEGIFYYSNNFKPGNRKGYFNKINSENFKTTSSDSIIQDNTPYGISKLYSQDYNIENGIFADKYDFVDNVKLTKFDLKGNILNEINLPNLINNQHFDGSFGVLYTDPEYVYTSGYIIETPFVPVKNFIKIYDRDLNLIVDIDSTIMPQNEDPTFIKSSIDKNSFYLFTYKKSFDIEDKDVYTNIYKIDKNSLELTKLISLPYNDSLQYALPNMAFETEDNLFVSYLETALRYNVNNEVYETDGNARAYTIISFDKNKLVNNKEILSHEILIAPNPANDFLRISNCKKPENIKLFDLSGKLITLPITKSENYIEIDISMLPASIYVLDFGGYQQKFVKI